MSAAHLQIIETIISQPGWLYLLALIVISGPAWIKAVRVLLGDLNVRAARKAALDAQTKQQRDTALQVLREMAQAGRSTDVPPDPELDPPPELPPRN